MGTFEVSKEHMVQLLRVIRHDFLNHIQVLDGLMKLNEIEGAKEYLQQMTNELRQQQLISDLGDAALTLYLFTYRVKYPMIQFEMECTERLHLNHFLRSEEHIRFLMQLLEEIGESSQQQDEYVPSLLLRMGKINDRIILECDFAGNSQILFAKDWWSSLKSSWINAGAIIHELVRTDEEWVIEIIMG